MDLIPNFIREKLSGPSEIVPDVPKSLQGIPDYGPLARDAARRRGEELTAPPVRHVYYDTDSQSEERSQLEMEERIADYFEREKLLIVNSLDKPGLRFSEWKKNQGPNYEVKQRGRKELANSF